MKHSEVNFILDNGIEVERENPKTSKIEKKRVKVQVKEVVRARGGLCYNVIGNFNNKKLRFVRSFRVGKDELTQ